MKATINFFDSKNLQQALLEEQRKQYLKNPYNYLSTISSIDTEDQEDQEDQEDIDTPIFNFTSSSTSNSTSDTNIYVKPLPKLTYKHVSGLSEDILGFLELCNSFPEVASKIKVTSGYRPGAKTKQGKTSFHASGNAIDIVPTNGTFDDLAEALLSHPEIIQYLKNHNLGILDETTPEIMAKTGATGKHYHIGPDHNARSGIYSLLTKYGIA